MTENEEAKWDAIIKQQADYYGMKVDVFKKFMRGAAIAQETAEATEEFQYKDDRYA